jgi:hypothetical protein
VLLLGVGPRGNNSSETRRTSSDPEMNTGLGKWVRSVEATRVRTTTPFRMRHRRIGLMLTRSFRHAWSLHVGRIIGCDHDAGMAMLQSFSRTIGLPATTQQP